MRRLIRAELFKLRSTPLFWWVAGATVALVTAATGLTAVLTTIHSERDLRSMLSFAGSGGLLLVVLGVVGAAGEYRHRTIIATLLVSPARRRVAGAQVAAYAIAGAAVGVACAATTSAIALPWLIGHRGVGLRAGSLLLLYVGGLAYCTLSAALGAGLGVLARNQAAAVAAVLVLLSVIDPAVSALFPAAGKFGPTALGIAISGGSAGTSGPFGRLLPAGVAVLVYLLYTGVLVAAATTTAVRRDIV